MILAILIFIDNHGSRISTEMTGTCPLAGFLIIFHTKKPALRLTFLILFILILSPILLAQRKKFLKRSYSLWLKFPCIHLLPVMLHPRIQPPFLQIIFGKIPMIRFYEGLYLIIVCHPSFLLYHRIQIIMMSGTCPLTGGLSPLTYKRMRTTLRTYAAPLLM